MFTQRTSNSPNPSGNTNSLVPLCSHKTRLLWRLVRYFTWANLSASANTSNWWIIFFKFLLGEQRHPGLLSRITWWQYPRSGRSRQRDCRPCVQIRAGKMEGRGYEVVHVPPHFRGESFFFFPHPPGSGPVVKSLIICSTGVWCLMIGKRLRIRGDLGGFFYRIQ